MINGNTLIEVPILKIVEDVQKLDEPTILKQLQELPKLKEFEKIVQFCGTMNRGDFPLL